MLKRTITYTDYEGVERTEDHYFNVTKAELAQLQLSSSGGYEKRLEAIIQSKDGAGIMSVIRDLIELSYGKKSPDGRRFMKSEEIYREFKETEAYSILFMELCTDDKIAADFVHGILPSDLKEKVDEEMRKQLEEVNVSTN